MSAPAITPTHAARDWNWLYPLGYLGLGFVDTIFTQWIVYLHAPPGSADPHSATAIGTVLLISFLLQGALNPVLGHVSDRLRHRRGRRLPFILYGGLPMALLFYLIWQLTSFWASLLLICLYGLLFVVVVQPYVALLPTIAPDPAQRVRYSLIGGVCSLVATGAALIAGPWLLDQGGFGIFGLLGAATLILSVFLPALLMRERVMPPETADDAGLLAQMRGALSHRPLAWFIAGNACVVMTMIALTILAPYLCETLLAQQRSYTSIANLWAFIGVLLTVGFVAWRGKRLSYLRLLRDLIAFDGLLLLGFGLASFYVPIPLPLWHACFVAVGCLVLVGMMGPNLILADFADRDAVAREGVIFGVNGLAISCANAFSSKTTAALLSLGKTAAQPLGVQCGLFFIATASLSAAIALTVALRAQPAQDSPATQAAEA